MLSKLPEKQMRLIRWLLAIGWLMLIVSLFYDPITPTLTDPNNASSPFRLNPSQCVKVQGKCLPEHPYSMTNLLGWSDIIAISIFILLVFGHELWRRICPLSFFSQLPRALGLQRKRRVVDPVIGFARDELAVKKGSLIVHIERTCHLQPTQATAIVGDSVTIRMLRNLVQNGFYVAVGNAGSENSSNLNVRIVRNFTEDIGDKENFLILRELATTGAEMFLQLEKSIVWAFPGFG